MALKRVMYTAVAVMSAWLGFHGASCDAEELKTVAEELIEVDTADFPENEELFKGYVENTLYEELYEDVAAYGNVGTSRLTTEEEKQIYSALKTQIEAVASGKQSSTKFELEQTFTWQSKDVGAEKITENNVQSVCETIFKNHLDINTIMQYLLMDCPYELYWYDEHEPIGFRYSYSYDDAQIVVSQLKLEIPVAMEYQVTDQWTMDSSKVQQAEAAKKKALDIVSKNAAKSDYEKLVAYKEAICELASYDFEIKEQDKNYGGPWQIIWVFDGNADTKVVCEGYAKSFQYLCDLSGLTCYTISGTMTSGTGAGAHMWNIVTLENQNYLVDVTNCDEDTIGYPDKLFLAGTTGSVEEGYGFPLDKVVGYYYNTNCLQLLGEEVLTLSSANYQIKTEGKWMYSSQGWWYSYSNGGYPANTWKQIDGEWYWFDAAGYMKTGWAYIGGQWYYLNASGAMVTGWAYIGGQWYYLNASGAMVTGWAYIGGQWYYLNASGAMVTGWLYEGTIWYYLKPNGQMTTGQLKIDGKMNAFDNSGKWLGYI